MFSSQSVQDRVLVVSDAEGITFGSTGEDGKTANGSRVQLFTPEEFGSKSLLVFLDSDAYLSRGIEGDLVLKKYNPFLKRPFTLRIIF